MSRIAVALVSGTLLLAALGAAPSTLRPTPPGDWPQWRGPARDGKSTESGLLPSWDAPPPLAWKAAGLGTGFASVSIADGRIFTMGDLDGGQHVIALDRDGGKQLWKTQIGDTFEKTGYHGPRCTPTVDGDTVYALGTGGELAALDVATGDVRWQKSLPRDFGGRMMSGWAYSESPLVDGDRLICTPGGSEAAMVALDKRTGSVIWKAAVPSLGEAGKDGAGYSSIVVSEACGTRQYVQLMGRGVVGIDADSGKFLWGYNRVANRTANIPTPLVEGDYVFCSSGYQTGAALLKLNRTGGGIEAEEVYFLPASTFQNHHGGMVMLGDYVYAGNGHNNGFPVCLEWKTGKVVWNGGRGPGNNSAAITYADGHVYFRYQNGVMALIEATPEGYRLKGSFEIPDCESPSWPHPVVAGGKLYLREQDQLFCYDIGRK